MFFTKQKKERIDRLFSYKILPCSLMHENKEYQPAAPCATCFPESHKQAETFEELGIRDLLTLNLQHHTSIEQSNLHKTLKNILSTIQVHWTQIEHLSSLNCHKIFMAAPNTPLDRKIVQFCVGYAQQANKTMQFDADAGEEISVFFERHTGAAAQIFLDEGNNSLILQILTEELRRNDLEHQIRVVFVSYAYEFHPSNVLDRTNEQITGGKPAVRVNFSQPHLLSELSSCKLDDIYSHIYHEIWKNTPVMISHVVGFLSRYWKYSKGENIEKWMHAIKSIRNLLVHTKFDVAAVGDLIEITRQSLKFLELPADVNYFSSVVVDSMKYQAIMAKSLFTLLEENVAHSETQQINKNSIFEKFRILTRILQNDIKYLQPPCLNAGSIESKTYDYFLLNGILSESSDEVLTVESRIAKNIARHLDIDSDEEEDLAHTLPVAVFVYVNIENLKATKWMVGIVDEMLEIYLLVARMTYDIRHVDVIEISAFLDRVRNLYSETFSKQWNERLDQIANAAMNALESERITSRYIHSPDVGIVYCVLPFQETRLLSMIHEISQFIF